MFGDSLAQRAITFNIFLRLIIALSVGHAGRFNSGLLQTKLDKTLAAKPKNKFSRFFFIFLYMNQGGLS